VNSVHCMYHARCRGLPFVFLYPLPVSFHPPVGVGRFNAFSVLHGVLFESYPSPPPPPPLALCV
jgi:hypothetical protein